MRLRGLRDIKTHGSLARERQNRTFPLAAASLHREPSLRKKIRLYQIEVIRDSLQEMQQAMAEGIPGAVREFERFMRRLKNLEAG